MKYEAEVFCLDFPCRRGPSLTHLTSKDIDLWIVERALLQLSSVVVAATIHLAFTFSEFYTCARGGIILLYILRYLSVRSQKLEDRDIPGEYSSQA